MVFLCPPDAPVSTSFWVLWGPRLEVPGLPGPGARSHCPPLFPGVTSSWHLWPSLRRLPRTRVFPPLGFPRPPAGPVTHRPSPLQAVSCPVFTAAVRGRPRSPGAALGSLVSGIPLPLPVPRSWSPGFPRESRGWQRAQPPAGHGAALGRDATFPREGNAQAWLSPGLGSVSVTHCRDGTLSSGLPVWAPGTVHTDGQSCLRTRLTLLFLWGLRSPLLA